jgi:chromate transporter
MVKGVFMGLRPVVVGLIASAALLLMNSANFGATSYDVTCSILICVTSFCLVFFTKLHPILVIVLAGIAGFFIF